MKESVRVKPALLLTKCTERAHWKTTVTLSFNLHLNDCQKTDLGITWENLYAINFTLRNKVDFQHNP